MSYYSLISLMPKAPAFDADAQAFITAAAITDVTQQNAINTLVLALKGYSIWTKFKAIYPIVGGTASSHKYNLKDPRDLNAAFRLTFATGVTHSSTGMISNGTSGYADTYFNPFANASLNSHHLSYYSRTNVNLTQVEIGALSGSAQDILEIRTAGTTYFIINQTAPYATVADTDSRAFYLGNRTASNVVNGWKNGVKVATATTSSTALINLNIYLLAYNNGIPALYSTKQCAFASIGDGLTDTDAANFYTAVQAFNTTLSRNV
jgi:hypothetical protein